MSRVKSIEEQLLETIGHKPRLTEEGVEISVKKAGTQPDVAEFIEKIKTMYMSNFPKGMFLADVYKILGDPMISICTGIIPEGKQANRILENDPAFHKFSIDLNPDGTMKDKTEIDTNWGGKLKINPEKGSHYAMGSVKFGWRKKSGNAAQILKHMDLYFKKMRSVVDANMDNIYGGSELIEKLREDSDDAYMAKVDGIRKRMSDLGTSVENLSTKIQAIVAKNKGMKHDDPKWDAAREKMGAMEGKRADQRAKIEELRAKLAKEIEKNKKLKKESVSESDLPADVIAKIKANNDKMTDLKKNGGSQEEIDALEDENDELNGGNDTAKDVQESAGKAFFGTAGQFNYAVKIKGFDPDDLSGNGPDSLKAMGIVRDFQKKAQRTYIRSKGKPNMAEIKKWVKEYGPSEFAVKWPTGNWNDDSVEMFYMGTNESKVQEARKLSSEERKIKDEVSQITGNIRKMQGKINASKSKDNKDNNSDSEKKWRTHARAEIAKMRAKKKDLVAKFKKLRGQEKDMFGKVRKVKVNGETQTVKTVKTDNPKDDIRNKKESLGEAISASHKKLIKLAVKHFGGKHDEAGVIKMWNDKMPHFGGAGPHRYNGADKTCAYCYRPKDWKNVEESLNEDSENDIEKAKHWIEVETHNMKQLDPSDDYYDEDVAAGKKAIAKYKKQISDLRAKKKDDTENGAKLKASPEDADEGTLDALEIKHDALMDKLDDLRKANAELVDINATNRGKAADMEDGSAKDSLHKKIAGVTEKSKAILANIKKYKEALAKVKEKIEKIEGK